MITKRISEIRRDEWVAYRWTDVTTYGDIEAVFARGAEQRSPDDAKKAAENWDTFHENYLSLVRKILLHTEKPLSETLIDGEYDRIIKAIRGGKLFGRDINVDSIKNAVVAAYCLGQQENFFRWNKP